MLARFGRRRGGGRRGEVAAIVAAALFAAGTGACSRIAPRLSAGTDSVYVGVAVGLQNPARYVNVFNGVQLALDELNASRPSGSPPLALRRAPTNATTSVQVAAAFRDDPAVVGVVGHTETDATVSAAPVYDDREHGGANALVAISPTAGGAQVTRASTWVFRVCPVVERQAELLARFAADSIGARRLAVVYRYDASGKEFLRALTDVFEKNGRVIVERDPFVEEIPEFGAYAERLAKRHPDGLMIYANASDAMRLLHAVHAAGLAPPALTLNAPSPESLKSDAAAAKDAVGLRTLALYDPDRPQTEPARDFGKKFTARFGSAADKWAALGYDAAMLIGSAVHEIGPDRQRVRDWIASVGQSRPVYVGVTGNIRFDDQRNPVAKAAVVESVLQ